MRNLYRMQSAPDAIAAFARELGRQLSFPESFVPRVSSRATCASASGRRSCARARRRTRSNWSNGAGAGPERPASRVRLSRRRPPVRARRALRGAGRRVPRVHRSGRPEAKKQRRLSAPP